MRYNNNMGKILNRYHKNQAILELENDFLRLVCTNYGCTILKLCVKENNGTEKDVVLGYDTLEEYQPNDLYLGAIVGRTANRIAKGHFRIKDKEYQLPINNGPNCNHGGVTGFTNRVFDFAVLDNKIRFHYFSKDGEEGYPGNLDAYVIYELKDNSLICTYQATTDQDTIINMTNHSYFNLSGTPSYIGNHLLQVEASHYGPCDSTGLFTGEFKAVAGTPFDFRTLRSLDSSLQSEDEDLKLGNGIDHTFLFHKKEDQVTLVDPESKLTLKVSTTLPACQIYTANYLDGRKGKNGSTNNFRYGLCIETGYLPNSINYERNSPTLLTPEKQYKATTVFTFEVEENENE